MYVEVGKAAGADAFRAVLPFEVTVAPDELVH